MKTRLIESLPGVLPDSLEIHGKDQNQDEDGVVIGIRMMGTRKKWIEMEIMMFIEIPFRKI